MLSKELDRLGSEYADREQRLAGSDIYSHFNLANLFIIQQRHRVMLNILRVQGIYPLVEKRIFELGCGGGGVLLDFLSWGATPSNLFGCDLLPVRLLKAHARLPHFPLACADGQNLPYSADEFDLVVQSTVLSSILDNTVKSNLTSEMLRVLKPDGVIIWYDFWLNPTNPQTRGISPPEIRRLFPGCEYQFKRITLAPPIVRKLASISWGLCLFLESLKIFNTHYLVTIRRED